MIISSQEDMIMHALRFDHLGDPAVLQVSHLPEGTAVPRPAVRTMS